MLDRDSRYFDLQTATFRVEDRKGASFSVVYKRRRFLPAPDAQTASVEYAVREGDRLDNVTARFLGDPAQFWRIADANRELEPETLVGELQRRIVIPLPDL